ncbi:MAG: acyl-CoA dehydrogenase family protein, partial [Nitrospira sp.]|nr:acyl-CoA dehydrogenase family protein [Nitrospira sp.]
MIPEPLSYIIGFVSVGLVVWVLAARKASGMVWTLAVAAGLGVWTAFTHSSGFTIAFAWTAFLAVSLSLNINFLRRKLMSDWVLRLFQKRMPPMSQTEREAIEAGTVWWDAKLFSGRPNWKKLLAIPKPTLTAEEQAFLDGPVEELCQMIDDWKINEEFHDLPEKVWQFMRDKGFFGMIIPKKYGGLEFSALAHSAVVMKVASRSMTSAVTVMVPNSIGPAELLYHYGTEEQKNHYLPRLARGEE